MNKVICDICGTSYQESAKCCPICGCSRDAAGDLLNEELPVEEAVENTAPAAAAAAPRKKKDIFDFDEVNTTRVRTDEDEDDGEDDDEDEDYDEEEEEEESRPNTIVIILLTILIAALLITAGFIFVKYFLPNMNAEETVPTTVATEPVQTTTAAIEETTVPCEHMMMNNEARAELNEIGQQFLLNIMVKPDNTTDAVVFTSGNDSVATVSADGKITAVGEGETVIYISCGSQSMECPVVVKYVEETVPPTTVSQETVPAETAPQETVPAETAPGYDPSITLKLKKTDIMLGVYYYFTLELDCDLEPTQVEWSSEHPHIASVDEKGVVTALKSGTTEITAKYGDQVVTCMVRCG